MDLKYFGTVAAAVFVLQFILCMKKAKPMVRLLPTAALALGSLCCAVIHVMNYSAMTAHTYGVLLFILLVLDGLAWIAAWVATKYRKYDNQKNFQDVQ